MLLQHEGYWTRSSFKVALTKEEKRSIGRASAPRWELDLVAFKGSTNEVLAVECKSYLDSTGVLFRDGGFYPPDRYKLFTDALLRKVVLNRLSIQLQEVGACASAPRITLCLAIGKFDQRTSRDELDHHFKINGWRLFPPEWFRTQLMRASAAGYENDVAFVVSKLITRVDRIERSPRRRVD